MLIVLFATLPSLPPAHCDHLFLFASTKLRNILQSIKHNYCLKVLMSTYQYLLVLIPNILRFFFGNLTEI